MTIHWTCAHYNAVGSPAPRSRKPGIGVGEAHVSCHFATLGGACAVADEHRILFDVGQNTLQESPSPLERNMEALGVASTGTIPRQLVFGWMDEQALVVHVEGRGAVLVVGCGHQTVSELLRAIRPCVRRPTLRSRRRPSFSGAQRPPESPRFEWAANSCIREGDAGADDDG